jgi:Fur family peroxide stress response transcriptional regulator
MERERFRERLDEIVQALAAAGHRLTPQRLAILEVLARSEGHPTANQVLRQVQRRFPMVGKATVYQTLELLKSLGQVLELEFRDAANRYDGAVPSPHPHVICTACGRIDDVTDPTFRREAERVAAAVGYEVVSHRFDVYGLCPTCRAKGRRVASNGPGRGERDPASPRSGDGPRRSAR